MGKLSPTSSVIHDHIRHSFCVIRNALNLFIRGYYAPSPEDYGWENDNGAIIQKKCLHPPPSDLLVLRQCSAQCDTRKMQIKGYVMCDVLSKGKGSPRFV